MFIKTPFRILAGVFGSTLFIAGSTLPVLASTTAYESFDYSSSIPDSTASTAAGFTGNWTNGTAPSISTGLTYLDLPTDHNSLSSTSGRQSVSLSDSLSSGTKWISFLFNMTGNNGGNVCGVYFPNGGTGLFLGYGLQPFSGTQGGLHLGSINSANASPQAASTLASSFLGTYGATPYLVAIKIDFNTSGANDTVTVYINPTANSTTPVVAATYTVTSFDVGTITGIGFQNAGGGFPIIADEIRVGDEYFDVVSNSTGPAPLAPLIFDVTPTSGLTTGGTEVTITGTNFLTGATVKFGPNNGTGVLLTGTTHITATTPAGLAGVVNVMVENTNTLSDTYFGGFTYLLPPLPIPTLVPGSFMVSGSNLTFSWMGTTNTTSVLLTTTNLLDSPVWIPAETNVFGVDGLATNSLIIPEEPAGFYRMSEPTEILVVQAPTGLQTIPSGSTDGIGLGWTASSTEGVIGYRILYGLDSGNLTNSMDVGNVNSTIISGLLSGQTYTLAVVALTADGQSLAVDATITAQTDVENTIVPLFNAFTALENEVRVETPTALITYIADRVRDRHAREAEFQLYDHYLSWYWEQRVANVQIIDYVAKGGTDITFNYTTQAPLGPAEFRTFFGGVTTVAQYNNNQIATLVSTTPSATPGETDYNYTATINQNANEGNRALMIGDRVEIEISQFLVGPRHGRNNYYGTTMLYIIGQGIVPWGQANELDFPPQSSGNVNHALDSHPLPTNAWLGGETTLPYQYSDEPQHRFKQTAGNISPTNGIPFMLGRRLHHTDFGDGTHSEAGNPTNTVHIGKLGPQYINNSCVACHVNNGRSLPPPIGTPLLQAVVKVGSDASGTPHPTLGSVLQPQSTSGPDEGNVVIASYTITAGQYGDFSPYTLRKPNYTFSGTTPSFYSVRIAPQLVGLGLLEAVSEDSIMALADPSGTNISGRIQTVIDPVTSQERLGRFTYKGGQASVNHQVAAALNTDMGIPTSVFPILDGDVSASTPELTAVELDQMTRYVALLGVGARRDLSDTQALQGEVLFNSANCTACHTPTLTTSPYHPNAELRNQTIHPYTDLLLHDMGPGLADNMGEGVATGSEWRTAPLWNIGLTAGVSGGEAYLHDGRAQTLEEAILWHGGEAEDSKEVFRNMSAAERAALIKFLQSL